MIPVALGRKSPFLTSALITGHVILLQLRSGSTGGGGPGAGSGRSGTGGDEVGVSGVGVSGGDVGDGSASHGGAGGFLGGALEGTGSAGGDGSSCLAPQSLQSVPSCGPTVAHVLKS